MNLNVSCKTCAYLYLHLSLFENIENEVKMFSNCGEKYITYLTLLCFKITIGFFFEDFKFRENKIENKIRGIKMIPISENLNFF